jgi:hypothetical protein
LLATYLLVLFIYFLKLISDYALGQNPWILGEWLVSYHAGYVRRGLAGSTILFFSDLSGVSVENVFQIFLGVIFGSFLLILFRVIKRSSVISPAGAFFMITSPMAVGFFLVDSAAVGRKEILLYLFAILWYRWIARNSSRIGTQSPDLIEALLYALAFTAILLSHEGFVFYVPILIFPVVTYCVVRKAPIAKGIPWGLPLFIPSAAISLLTLVNSSNLTAEHLCRPLLARGLDTTVCDGALEFAIQSSFTGLDFALEDVSSIASTWTVYVVVGILGVIPMIYFGLQIFAVNGQNLGAKLIIYSLGLLAISSPMYILGSDWGRYTSAFITLASVGTLVFSAPTPFVSSKFPISSTRTGRKLSEPALYLAGTVQFLFLGVSVRGGEYKNTSVTLIGLVRRAIEVLFS